MRRARPGAAPRGAERTLTSVKTGGGRSGTDAAGPAGPPDAYDLAGGASPEGTPVDGSGARDDQTRLWHVTLSVSGAAAPLPDVRRSLEQLAHDHPFLLTSRYAADHAEIRYWEEARDLHDAAAVALRLWGEHRQTAQLPPWEIVGLEVINRETYHQRIAEGYGPPPAAPVGVHPF